jgi:transglutaminase-like putative cysteine protease
MAYMEPRAHAAQVVLDHVLLINPLPAQMRSIADVYGNARCFFSLQTPHEVLSVVAHSLVSTRPSPIITSLLPWEKVREMFRYQAGSRFDAASEFVFPSPFVPRHIEFAAFARASFTPGMPLLNACIDLMQRMHAEFTYESLSTQINTPALEALAQRKGVCQDFSHIMIACLRTLGLPARYVSGYMLTHPPEGQPRLVGSDASHAWVSVYLPDLPESNRWVDFDPTNNRWGWHAPGEDYVTVASGRDFGDVSPLRGVIHGGASHTLTVGVTVAPVGENAEPEIALRQTQTQTQTQSQSQSQSQSQNQS